MKRLVVLHTNDVHGNVEGLARVATLVERIRAESDCPVVYVDAGDVEETTTWISNATKGAAMHRLLSAAGCAAAAVGNASWFRYGTEVLPDHAVAASYPLLLANLRAEDGSRLEGVVDSTLLEVEGGRLGLIGVTAPALAFGFDDLGVSRIEEAPLVRRLAGELRERGADYVVLLSHLGLDVPDDVVDDRRLAPELPGAVDAVLGAHTHDLLPEGERIGGVLVAQAGSQGSHLGRLELGPDGVRAEVLPIGDDLPLHPAVVAAAAEAERDVEAFVSEIVGELPEALDPAAAARWLADVLRRRLDADVGIVTPGQAFTKGLPAGPLTRSTLWDACDSSANPGTVTIRGARLAEMLARGRDPAFARGTAWPLRGRPRGVLQTSGDEPVEPDRDYRVAGTDWELHPLGGLVEPEWALEPRYEFPTILREVIEEHFARNGR
jgi:2',3'-cyclic-nucleotide 2'-phosphodiesterase (5'-nucleotidase family)